MTYRPANIYPARERTRRCQVDDCDGEALTAHLYCGRHATTPEGVAFYHEVQAAAAAMRDLEDAGSDEIARRERAEQFGRRIKRGKFTGLLDKAMTSIIEEAAEREEFDLERGALRFAIARTLTEETDAHRMSLSVARLANAISRLSVAHYATRDPKPVVRYGQEWNPPLPLGEGMVHYIWRHRPEDFTERYMTDIADPESDPINIEHQVETDYRHNLKQGDGKDANGRYGSPPLPEYRK